MVAPRSGQCAIEGVGFQVQVQQLHDHSHKPQPVLELGAFYHDILGSLLGVSGPMKGVLYCEFRVQSTVDTAHLLTTAIAQEKMWVQKHRALQQVPQGSESCESDVCFDMRKKH